MEDRNKKATAGTQANTQHEAGKNKSAHAGSAEVNGRESGSREHSTGSSERHATGTKTGNKNQ